MRAHALTTRRQSPLGNRLVAALPPRSQQRFLASCVQVDLKLAQILCTTGERIDYVYFPMDSFISAAITLEGDARLAIGIVGNEGMLGMCVVLGMDISPQHAVVQGPGRALRMSTTAFRRHCAQSIELRRLLGRYIYVLMAQLSATAACTLCHRVEMRLACWLLMTRDSAHADDFHLTHESLANMLGVRRAGVTEAAHSLLVQGLIKYTRGHITILDAPGLRHASCACYLRGKKMYEQTFRPRRLGRAYRRGAR